jgi:hypothetical protein
MPETTVVPLAADEAPSLAEVTSRTTAALKLEHNAPQRVIDFEKGIRSFTEALRELSPSAFKERLAFAQENREFPVMAEWRFNLGRYSRETPSLEADLGQIASYLSKDSPNPVQRLLQFGRDQTHTHLQKIREGSPAIAELQNEIEKLGFDLILRTDSICTNSTYDLKGLRFLAVLRGTEVIRDPSEYRLGDDVKVNPAVLGESRLY